MASGKITGTCTGSRGQYYTIWIEWSSTVNAAGNYSLVSATAYVQSKDTIHQAYNLNVSASNKSVTVNGKKTTSTANGIDLRNRNKVTIATVKNQKVMHDSNGKKSITISASFGKVVDDLTGGSASKTVALDNADSTPPTFSVQPKQTAITQNSVSVSFTPAQTVDVRQYSIDGKKTWHTITSNNFTVTGLSAYKEYFIYVRVRKASNGVYGVSNALKIKTLPIYVTSIVQPTPVSVNEEGYIDFVANVLPTNASIKTVTLSSSNPDIARTDGSRIYGVKNGSVTITAVANDGSGVSTTFTVNVTREVAGIEVASDSIMIPNGTTVKVPYKIIPSSAENKSVTIVSDNEEVVTVSNGIATAVGYGTATLTITTVEGGFSAELKVDVIDGYLWYSYDEPIKILNTEDVDHIMSNIQTIRSMLIAEGYSVDDLIVINAQKSLRLSSILDILQSIEYNLDRINDNDVKSIYYGSPVTIGEYASNEQEIWRWIQILNDMYNVLNGTFGKWSRLLCTDGYPTINGKKILVRGDLIG